MMLLYLEFVYLLVSVLLSGGFFTLFERKVMGSMQYREGPSKVIVLGFMQPVSDALKLFSKTNVSVEMNVDLIYYMCPFVSFFLSLMCWIVFPVWWGLFSWYSSMLFVMFCFSVSIYGVILSGWFSRSKFASLGCIRALSQSVSYEVPLSVILLTMSLVFSTFSLSDIACSQDLVMFVFPFGLLMLIMIVVMMAEVNRAPFDLAEGESELVSGFSVELGSSTFVLVFLSEYVSIVWCSLLMSVLFLGGAGTCLMLKMMMFMFLFVWARCSFPRIRYDDVMIVCWYSLLPLAISMMVMLVCLVFNQSQSSGMLLLMVKLTLVWLLR